MKYILFILGLTSLISLAIYYMDQTYEILGYVKVATIFQYSFFLFIALMLLQFKKHFFKLPVFWLDVLIVIGFFLIMGTFFEVMFGFGYWFTIHGVINNNDVNNAVKLDSIAYTTKTELFITHRNLNAAVKNCVGLLFASIYFTYFINNIKLQKLMIYE